MYLVRVTNHCAAGRARPVLVLQLLPTSGLGTTTGGVSGLASREQVERLVEVEVPVTITTEVEVEVLPKGASWAKALTQLAEQIDRGRIYDRDLAGVAEGLDEASKALMRRTWWKARRLDR